MLKGSCLCGAVAYEIDGPLGTIAFCHCSLCRKASGTAFATNASVLRTAFRVVRGETSIGAFESSPGKRRAFCRDCGSPLYSENRNDPDHVRVRLGTLDADPESRPAFHFDVASKAPWFEITDALPQIELDGTVRRPE